MMKKLLSAIVLLTFLLAACSPALPVDGAVIPWDEAVHLLHTGHVTQVFQAHSLQVTMTLDNGATVSTTEPSIDEIFFEIEACGAPCANIAQATE
jgi:hypothetical protein